MEILKYQLAFRRKKKTWPCMRFEQLYEEDRRHDKLDDSWDGIKRMEINRTKPLILY